jgi:hypothetical protein
MYTYPGRIKKHIIILIIAAVSAVAGLSGCTKDPKTLFGDCMKEEQKVNPNYYSAQLNCSNKTGYSPY